MNLTSGYRRRAIAVVLLLATASVASGQNAAETLQQEAMQKAGTEATLCGLIVGFQCENRQGATALAFEKPFPQTEVAIQIGRDDRPRFGVGFEVRHQGRQVCATGLVERVGQRAVVRVSEPSQITIKSGPPPDEREIFSRCDPGVVPPTIARRVGARYTAEALRRGIEGAVLLEAIVLPDGRVADVRVVRSLDREHGLDKSSIDVAKQWRFTPATLDGRPVTMAVTIELSYSIKR